MVGLVTDDGIINLGFVLRREKYDQYSYLVYPTYNNYIEGDYLLVRSESLISYDLQLYILNRLEEWENPTIQEINAYTLLF